MTFFKADDTWALWTILIAWAAVSIYLEQKYNWAAKISGAIIALLGALILANLKIIPTDAPVYDAVWGYIVPLAVPLLLFKADLKKIWKESGRTFLAFNIGAVGTILGAFIACFLLSKFIPEIHKAAAMMTGSYIGGGVNFVAMSEAFKASKNQVNALIVADNLNMAIYFMILMAIPASSFFKKHYGHPYEDAVEKQDKASAGSEGQNKAASYWGRKEISLLDIAEALGMTFVIVFLSVKFCAWVNATNVSPVIKSILGQKYFVITTLTVVLATLFPKFLGEIRGAQEIGTFMIYIFFVVIGAPADLKVIILNSPILLVLCLIMVIVNMLVTFSVGKLLKFNVEELCIASNANIGGPTTAAAMAIAKGWTELVLPAMLVGVWGYVIGNYLGIFTGNILGKLFGM
ncbi:Uncharacterized membrane protein [Caloramator quimbayensis]|uniref:Uncharacterized membrane protein n=1 Tax=Caloramator quimbayensis TaxID=1147123 RepID=A0A1T4X7P4_9CLOT|nr:DUF819 family protein [Caloramator quimbayensis]SKA85095.1 Uncharacterized membrane protein [Caloramator quimbayensis]